MGGLLLKKWTVFTSEEFFRTPRTPDWLRACHVRWCVVVQGNFGDMSSEYT